MAVIVDGKTNAIKESSYIPGIQDSGDLSGGALVIVAVAEPAAADFTVPLTIVAPTDARWAVASFAAVVGYNVTAADGNFRCRVYVDVQDPANLILDRTTAGAVPDFDAATVSGVWIPAVFALLSDGLPHDFLFFLWKDGAGVGTTLNALELFAGVGSGDGVGAFESLAFAGARGLATISGLFGVRFAGFGATQTNIICTPAGAGLTADVAVVGPTAGDQPLSLVEGGGNWFNTRPVHLLGSLGVITEALVADTATFVSYLRIIWNDIE